MPRCLHAQPFFDDFLPLAQISRPRYLLEKIPPLPTGPLRIDIGRRCSSRFVASQRDLIDAEDGSLRFIGSLGDPECAHHGSEFVSHASE